MRQAAQVKGLVGEHFLRPPPFESPGGVPTSHGIIAPLAHRLRVESRYNRVAWLVDDPAISSGPTVIHRAVTDTVGRTPMIELGRVAKGLPGRVVAKLE
jgi:hypothetical protein